MTAKAQIGKQRRKTLCGSAKQLLDAKGKATAQAAARQQQHRYVITSYKQAMYSRSAAGVIELLTWRVSELKRGRAASSCPDFTYFIISYTQDQKQLFHLLEQNWMRLGSY